MIRDLFRHAKVHAGGCVCARRLDPISKAKVEEEGGADGGAGDVLPDAHLRTDFSSKPYGWLHGSLHSVALRTY